MENEYYPKKTFKRSGKKKPRCSLFKLRNPWGNESYRDLITNAILSSPSKQLTLAEIYSWMTENIPYFKENDKPKSHGGWKNSVRRNLSLNDRFVKTERSFHSKYPGYYWTVILDVESTTKPLDNEADRNLDHSTGSFWSLYDREGLGYGNDQIPPPPPSYEESLFYNIYAEANTTPEYVHHLQVHFEDENWWENNMQSNFAPWPAPAGYAATDITAFCDTSIPQSEPLISTSPNQSAQSVSNISVQQTANHQQQQQDQQATQLQAVDAMPTGATTFPANASTDNVLVSGKVCLVGCTCTSCANCVKSHSMNNETPKKRDITFGSFHPCM